ncbi:unnamed protein product, partial [marine sediment metagenome]
ASYLQVVLPRAEMDVTIITIVRRHVEPGSRLKMQINCFQVNLKS